MKTIYLVGNCNKDGPAIKQILKRETSANVLDIKTMDEAESLVLENKNSVDLVLVNRIGEFDHREGLELVDFIKSKQLAIPIILLTNYKDKQEESIDHGACPGFGKADILGSQEGSQEYKSAIGLVKSCLSKND